MRTLVGHRQNKYYSWRKTANSLPRRFSVNIYRTLPLSSVLAPIEKRFVRETFSRWECYICSLKVLYTDSSDRGNTMSMKNFLGIKSVYDDYKQQKRKKWARQVPWLACYWLRPWLWSLQLTSNNKALVNEDTLLRTHFCPWCFLGCANWETFFAGTKCFCTK